MTKGTPVSPLRKSLIGLAFLGATLGGAALGAVSIGSAGAATSATTSTATDSTTTDSTAVATDASTTDAASTSPGPGRGGQPPSGVAPDPSKGRHQANGITETVLTGDDATKVTDAALAAVPGATVIRVETDAEGAAFEAHITTADGTHQTVKLNADYSVASIEDGMA